jgi:NAD(P)-dependent dehydrogenase (short-subunit alcohol dehydrogenase family)
LKPDPRSEESNGVRRAVVTGSAHGLGLAIARRLSAEGAHLLLVDSDPTVLKRVSEKPFDPQRTFAMVKDLADADAGPAVFEKAADCMGLIDALINDAAWSFHKPMQEVTTAEFDRVVHINQRAPFFLAKEFVRQIRRAASAPADPVIINIASVNALAGNPNLVAYAGTKGALLAMTRAMAVEMRDEKVRVNAICPAAIRTHVTSQLIASGEIDPVKLFERYLIQRFASSEEIAELVAYLCSRAATYVNGATWEIDGGYLAQ